jgi:hypothetical protein
MPRPQGAPEKCERPLVGVEHHLLCVARIGAREHHAAVAKAYVRDLDDRRHAVQQDDLVAPIKLIGLARRKHQRHIGVRRRARVVLPPADRIAANGGVTSLVTEAAQFFVQSDER